MRMSLPSSTVYLHMLVSQEEIDSILLSGVYSYESLHEDIGDITVMLLNLKRRKVSTSHTINDLSGTVCKLSWN